MKKSKVIGIRINEPLLTQIQNHEMSNSTLIKTVMNRYFLENKNNIKSTNGQKQTTLNQEYRINNQEIINTLKEQITDLKTDKQYLQNQNEALLTSSIPFLQRIKMRLLTK